MKDLYFVSTDKSRLDIQLIYQYLSFEAYWAKGRSMETVMKSIDHSLCFGLYHHHEGQVGFARVVTDFAIFAWLMDVFVLPDHRGKGLGKLLMDTIMSSQELQEIKRWGLNTEDAHGFYEGYGFKNTDRPEIYMERLPNPTPSS